MKSRHIIFIVLASAVCFVLIVCFKLESIQRALGGGRARRGPMERGGAVAAQDMGAEH